MVLRFFNTLAKRKQVFRPITNGHVTMYNCGPTVYDFAHIGNFRAYVFADVLRRYLEWKGFQVRQVMNLTDVDDKTIRGAHREGVSLQSFTKRYSDAFFQDIATLNIKPASLYPRATEHIREMISITKALLDRGIAYRGADGIYFSISKFRPYGRLSGFSLEGLKPGARVRQDEYDKESANDFALWKFWDKEDGDVFWESPFGRGRPGWHIECSAMSGKHLGETIDIHTGGVDLVFPHHENEIAQTESFTGKPFVHYWLHNNHLVVDGRKMSKSLGNFLTLRDIVNKGTDPAALRYFLLSGHYRATINLTPASLSSAERTVCKIRSFVRDMAELSRSASGTKPSKRASGFIKKSRLAFEKAMDDDLSLPDALSAMFSFMTDINTARDSGSLSAEDASEAYGFMLDLDRVLGLGLASIAVHESLPQDVMLLVQQREQLRKGRDFSGADKIRSHLRKLGYELEDTPQGPRCRRVQG